jgi:tetratricopeptide (TPR) repeat protein
MMQMSLDSDVLQRQTKASELVTKGCDLLQEGRFDEAKKILEEAIETNPFNGTAYGNMGGCYYLQGQYAEAIPWLEKALEIHPNLEGIAEALAESRVKAKGGLGTSAGGGPVAAQDVQVQSRVGGQRKSGCFIATAACGADQAPEVLLLQQFREQVLRPRLVGRTAIAVYETVSPPLARLIERSEFTKQSVRKCILRPACRFARMILRQ